MNRKFQYIIYSIPITNKISIQTDIFILIAHDMSTNEYIIFVICVDAIKLNIYRVI